MSTYKITCPGCGHKSEGDSALSGTDVVCPSCSLQFKAPTLLAPASGQADKPDPPGSSDAASDLKGLGRKFVTHVTQLAGEDGIEEFNFQQLFSQVWLFSELFLYQKRYKRV